MCLTTAENLWVTDCGLHNRRSRSNIVCHTPFHLRFPRVGNLWTIVDKGSDKKGDKTRGGTRGGTVSLLGSCAGKPAQDARRRSPAPPRSHSVTGAFETDPGGYDQPGRERKLNIPVRTRVLRVTFAASLLLAAGPVLVPTIAAADSGPYVQIDAGAWHTCALKVSGAADCWGDNSYGQAEDQPGPFTQIATRYRHTCGLTPTGAVGCWGASRLARDMPGPYTQISVGDWHTCALTPAGAADCWGNNGFGQAEDQPGPYAQIAAAQWHTCALTPAGAVDCWGGRPDYSQVEDRPGPYGEISVGYGDTCGLTLVGVAECWGDPDHLGPYTQIASDLYGNCALTLAGEADCFDGDYTYPLHTGPFTQIDAGGFHVCGLLASGEAECWGHSHAGQTGFYLSIDAPRIVRSGRVAHVRGVLSSIDPDCVNAQVVVLRGGGRLMGATTVSSTGAYRFSVEVQQDTRLRARYRGTASCPSVYSRHRTILVA